MVTEDEMVNLYQQGVGFERIARMAGCGHKRVRQTLENHDVPIREYKNQPRPWLISEEESYRRYLCGESAVEVGAAAGVHGVTVANVFRKRGWPVRSLAEGARLRSERQRTHLDDARLRDLYESGLSIDKVADAMGSTRKTVSNAMKRLGIERRGQGSPGVKNRNWRGGYSVDKQGYILVRRPDHPASTRIGYVRAHRLVAEGILGRMLTPVEAVDHKDGDTSNNDPDNLRVYPDNGHHLHYTKTGSRQLRRERREELRLAAVRRARQRVAATLAELENDADWSHVAWPRPSIAPRKAAPSPSGRVPQQSVPGSIPSPSTPTP